MVGKPRIDLLKIYVCTAYGFEKQNLSVFLTVKKNSDIFLKDLMIFGIFLYKFQIVELLDLSLFVHLH